MMKATYKIKGDEQMTTITVDMDHLVAIDLALSKQLQDFSNKGFGVSEKPDLKRLYEDTKETIDAIRNRTQST